MEPTGRRDVRATIAAIIAVGLTVSIVLYAFVRRTVQEELDQRFAAADDGIQTTLEAGLARYAGAVLDLRAVFVTDPLIDQAEYSELLEVLDLGERLDGLLAVNFVRNVRVDEQDSFTRRTGIEVHPGLPSDRPAPVIELVHPLAANVRAIGLEIGSVQGAAGAVAEAGRSGEIRASDAIVLVQDAEAPEPAFVLYAPVYDRDVDELTDPAERADALLGWTSAAFRAQDFLESLDFATRVIGFVLRDPTTPVAAVEDGVLGSLPADLPAADEVERREVRRLEVFGQDWELELRALPALAGSVDRQAPWIVLVGGLLSTATAALYVGSVRRAELRAVRGEAAARSELERANAALELSNQRLAERNAAVGLANANLAEANRRLEETNTALEVTNIELADANERLNTTISELSDVNDRLVAANEVKDDFLAVVSHEFRTPLTVIRGFASTVLDAYGDDLPDRVRDAIGRIDRNADRLNTLVDDLLVAARIERGVISPSPVPVDLRLLVLEIVEELAWPESDLSLELAPVTAFADSSHTRRVVENLLGNAHKYGAAPIVVRTSVEQDAAVVEVRDHGPGIPEEMREAVFTPFTQGDSGPTRRTQGVGLGLAISRQLAELNHGTLDLVDDGDGACFVLRVPLPQPTSRAAPVSSGVA